MFNWRWDKTRVKSKIAFQFAGGAKYFPKLYPQFYQLLEGPASSAHNAAPLYRRGFDTVASWQQALKKLADARGAIIVRRRAATLSGWSDRVRARETARSKPDVIPFARPGKSATYIRLPDAAVSSLPRASSFSRLAEGPEWQPRTADLVVEQAPGNPLASATEADFSVWSGDDLRHRAG